MPYIIFENEGELDIRALTIMGLNVKETDTPIGYFGTGFKYGVAVAVRNGCSVIIQDGTGVESRISQADQEFRGQTYSGLRLEELELPFTTDLGKKWELWQAYREFKSNCMDEGGEVSASDLIPTPEQGKVRILVHGGNFSHIHENSDQFFWDASYEEVALDEKTLRSAKNPGSIFHRGIYVGGVGGSYKTEYSYNFLRQIDVSEDRIITTRGLSDARGAVITAMKQSHKESVLEELITQREVGESFESPWSLYLTDEEDSLFNEVAKRIYKTNRLLMREDLANEIEKNCGFDGSLEPIPMSKYDMSQRDLALQLLKPLQLDLGGVEIVWKANLGETRLGMVKKGVIYISKRSFDDGAKVIAATLVEEYIHAVDGFDDYTREFQDRVLRMLVNVLADAT